MKQRSVAEMTTAEILGLLEDHMWKSDYEAGCNGCERCMELEEEMDKRCQGTK